MIWHPARREKGKVISITLLLDCSSNHCSSPAIDALSPSTTVYRFRFIPGNMFLGILLPTLALFSTLSFAKPLKARPGTVQDIIIAEDNTVNGTTTPRVKTLTTSAPLRISITNNMSGSNSLTAYITGRDANGAVVFLDPSGAWYYPDPDGSTAPVLILDDVALPLSGFGETATFTLPSYISAARVWVSEGPLSFYAVSAGGTQLVEPSFANPNDPSSMVNWGFLELTYLADGIWANLSFVDFVSLVMGMRLTLGSGEVQTRRGLVAGAINNICNDLIAQTAIDGQPWNEMCVTGDNGDPLRILSPNIYLGLNRIAFSGYWDGYIDDVVSP